MTMQIPRPRLRLTNHVQKEYTRCVAWPSFSSAGRHARSSMAGGPQMKVMALSPGGKILRESISCVTNPTSYGQSSHPELSSIVKASLKRSDAHMSVCAHWPVGQSIDQ